MFDIKLFQCFAKVVNLILYWCGRVLNCGVDDLTLVSQSWGHEIYLFFIEGLKC